MAVNSFDMVRLIEKEHALEYACKYFDELARTGYVKGCTMHRMTAYMFIVDFIETLYPFIGESEYKTIGMAMTNLFGKDSCLFPYPVFCINKNKLGLPYYMGGNTLRRQMGSGEMLKRLEVEKLRGV